MSQHLQGGYSPHKIFSIHIVAMGNKIKDSHLDV